MFTAGKAFSPLLVCAALLRVSPVFGRLVLPDFVVSSHLNQSVQIFLLIGRWFGDGGVVSGFSVEKNNNNTIEFRHYALMSSTEHGSRNDAEPNSSNTVSRRRALTLTAVFTTTSPQHQN